MKIFILTLSLFFTASLAFCQKNNFVYVQTDNKQAFYIKIADKLYSSSAAGYAIIPKLQKGEYIFSVGFPKNEWPLQTIKISVNNDEGFMLKNFGDKGWGLYNIHTMDVAMSQGFGRAGSPDAKTDGFSNGLAAVVNTPSLGRINAGADTVLTEPSKPSAGSVPGNSSLAGAPNVKQTYGIKVLSLAADKSGTSAVYLDKNEGGIDTIRIFIPAIAEKPGVVAAVKAGVDPVQQATSKRVEAEANKKFLDIELSNPNNKADSATENAVLYGGVDATSQDQKTLGQQVHADSTRLIQPGSKTLPGPVSGSSLKPLMINSDCKSIASDDDFLKTRKKMAAEADDDDMIAAAKKLLKMKCYSTDQVRNLSVLFLKDSGKYGFFDAAYPYISDTYKFSSLETQLSDPYYISRFKAMIRN